MSFTPRRAHARTGAAAVIGALVSSTLLMTPAQAAERVLDETDVNQAYTRAAGSNTFLDDGVRIETVGTTSLSKAAGYFDVDQALAVVGEPAMRYTPENGTTARPGLQLVVDLDGNGTSDGILVGEPAAYGENWWLPGRTLGGQDVDPAFRAAAPKVGGGGSVDNGPLSQWRTAFPEAQVVQAGWSLGSGVEGRGVISRITVADDYYFSAAQIGSTTLRRGDVAPRDTRTQGRNTFRPTGGVRIFTLDNSSQAKATGYFAVGQALGDVGEPTWDYRSDEGIEPGKQLIVDLDGSLETTGDRGTLVGEPVYGKNWWLTNGSSASWKAVDPSGAQDGGNGSIWFGTLNEWRLAAPDALVIEAGWSLGSGVKADGVLTTFRVGQTDFGFAGNRAPVAQNGTASTPKGKAVDVTPVFADPDTAVYTSPLGGTGIADTLTVTVDQVDGGTATVLPSGDIRFTPADDFAGDASVTYTVTDDRGLSDTAAFSVSVTNTAPVADDASGTVLARSSSTVDRSVVVPLTATDADGDDLTYTVGAVTGGTATRTALGLRFTPAPGFSGDATVEFTVSDGTDSDTGRVVVDVRKGEPTIGATSRTLPSRNTYVTGTVTSPAGTNPSASTGQAVIVTRGGVEIGRGRVIDGKLVDRIKRDTRPGILVGEFRRGSSFGVTLVYPGTSTVAPRTQRVQMTIPR